MRVGSNGVQHEGVHRPNARSGATSMPKRVAKVVDDMSRTSTNDPLVDRGGRAAKKPGERGMVVGHPGPAQRDESCLETEQLTMCLTSSLELSLLHRGQTPVLPQRLEVGQP